MPELSLAQHNPAVQDLSIDLTRVFRGANTGSNTGHNLILVDPDAQQGSEF